MSSRPVEGRGRGSRTPGWIRPPLGGPWHPPAIPEFQGCGRDDYQDQRGPGAPRVIRWTHGLGPERCTVITSGQAVTFTGDFSQHPLDAVPSPLPDPPDNPIARHDAGVVLFARPGLFGFVCGSHPTMRGAVWVWQ